MNSVCGIDFGTSNSAVGVATTKDDLSLVDLDYGKTVIPTAVFYRNWNKRAAVFGETAQNFYFEKKRIFPLKWLFFLHVEANSDIL